MLILIAALVFLVSLAMFVSAAYFVVEAPLARRQMQVRLESIQQSGTRAAAGQVAILRQEVMDDASWVDRLLVRLPFHRGMRLYLAQAGVQAPASLIVLISASLALFAAILSLAMRLPAPLILVPATFAAIVPFAVVALKRRRRLARFEESFPDAIDLLSRAVRAGHAFTTGFSLIGNEMPEPVAGEFRTTYEQQNLGLPLSEALQNLADRVPLPDVRIFTAGLTIQRESGGNLSEVLENLSAVIRERFKILRQVQVFTAEGRLSLYILTGMPPASAVLMYLANPKYMSRLFTEPMGHYAIGAAIVLQIIGFLVIRRLIRIKV
jgi:tight adherence protein B